MAQMPMINLQIIMFYLKYPFLMSFRRYDSHNLAEQK